jgi:hypothetical protein
MYIVFKFSFHVLTYEIKFKVHFKEIILFYDNSNMQSNFHVSKIYKRLNKWTTSWSWWRTFLILFDFLMSNMQFFIFYFWQILLNASMHQWSLYFLFCGQQILLITLMYCWTLLFLFCCYKNTSASMHHGTLMFLFFCLIFLLSALMHH